MDLPATLKRIVKGVDDISYHHSHKKQAARILHTIESVKGKIPERVKKYSDEYAADVLGWKGYSPWLYVYSSISGAFKEGWIPDNYYGRVVLPAVTGKFRRISNQKTLARRLIRSDAFPDVLYFVNGKFFSKDLDVIQETDVEKYLFSEYDSVIFKKDGSVQGRGVFQFSASNFNIGAIKILGDGVFQEYIKQHGLFNEIIAGPVATLRITSLFEIDGSVSVRASYLRAGRANDGNVRSSSHVRIPIDRKTGSFSQFAYMPNWLRVEKHPDSQFVFAGNVIPKFNKCLDTVKRLHKEIPYVMCIGWDVCVDNNDNVKIMEWNSGHNDIKFSEAVEGPCFSDLGWEKLWRKGVS